MSGWLSNGGMGCLDAVFTDLWGQCGPEEAASHHQAPKEGGTDMPRPEGQENVCPAKVSRFWYGEDDERCSL